MNRIKGIIILLVAISFLAGCDKLPDFLRLGPQKEAARPVSKRKITGPVLAKINDRVITLDDLNAKFDSLPQQTKDAYLKSPQGKIGFLYELVDRELLVEEALAQRLDKDKEIISLMEDFKNQLLYNKILTQEIEKAKVTPKEIEDYYNSFRQEFVQPAERKVRVIVVPTEAEARPVLIQLLQGADFSTLAKQKSIDSSKAQGGDYGFIVRKTQFTSPEKKTAFPKFEEIAFSLDKGGVSSIFKGPDGYYIIKLDEIKSPQQQTLSERWDDIERALQLVKQRQTLISFLDKLRKQAKPYEIHEELVE